MKKIINENYIGLNGHANGIPSDSVVVYKSANDATPTHELFHACGLYHTFSNTSEYTFEKTKTDNIMDYSHQAGIDRISTLIWQWNKMRQ